MNFIAQYPVSQLRPAEYNPRKISSESFETLKDSLVEFGMVKPIIINGDGTITAGHQRIRAAKEIGLEFVPVIQLQDISLHDEIRFNLYHNSIETNKSSAQVNGSYRPGYNLIPQSEITTGKNLNASVTKHIADLYLRYGNWGSVISDEAGRVILNSDYAVVMAMYGESVLTYCLPPGKAERLITLLGLDYGEYHYSALDIKPYVQYHCQMNRIKRDGKESLRSTLYERFVLPQLDITKRLLDFGAGKMAYVEFLRKKGVNIFGYEPYVKKSNHEIFIEKVKKDLDKIRRDIILNKLYDVVILDSVLNSITSLEYERNVLITCNALMKKDAVLYISTRCMESVEERKRATKSTQRARVIEFMDRDNFSATFRQGNWTVQRFHSIESLSNLLQEYFEDVIVSKGSSQNYAVCRLPKPLPIEQYRTALNIELNMEYPGEYRHNCHTEIVNEILKLIKERDVSHN